MDKKKRVCYPISSETAEQETVVEYCAVMHIPIVHIPNEGKRSVSYASMLKRIGLAKGFPDLFVPVARKGYHGLFIEMKYGRGKLSKDQSDWLDLLAQEGYLCKVCYSADEAIRAIVEYAVSESKGAKHENYR